jgi:hypothetical protein
MTRELDQSRHTLARELEAYKAGVLKDLEQFRANIDIKRTMALKMADARLDALRALAVAHDTAINEVTTMMTMSQAERQANADEYLQAMRRQREPLRSAEIFMPQELVAEVTTGVARASVFFGQLLGENRSIEADSPELQEISRPMVICANK